jgi:two-component system alkaline phosphatase synthesis response regulator PhoP
MAEPRKVLIIEDDTAIVDLLVLHLRDQGYETRSSNDGSAGLELALTGNFDLIVLDVMLPGLDGLSVCRNIRAENVSTPILMLTAKSEEIDKIVGLEIGADDYMTKPFSIRELIARIRATFRRIDGLGTGGVVIPDTGERHFGTLRIDAERRLVYSAGKKIDLTSKEFDLLALLSKNPGKAFTRQELLEQVWGYQFSGYSHTVNSHINRLRAKIEKDPGKPEIVETVWGYGYRFSESEEEK